MVFNNLGKFTNNCPTNTSLTEILKNSYAETFSGTTDDSPKGRMAKNKIYP